VDRIYTPTSREKVIAVAFRTEDLRRCIKLLPKRDRRKIKIVIAAQLALSGLDLLGVASVGILGALAVRGIQSTAPGDRVSSILQILGIQNLNFQQQVMILGFIAAGVFVMRTVASVYITKRTFAFLSYRSAEISSEQISKILSNPRLILEELNPQEIIYAATSGVSALVLGVVGSGVIFISDAALLIVIAFGLLVVDTSIAISTILIFGIIGYFVFKLLSNKARHLGSRNTQLNVESNNLIVELLGAYRENQVKSRQKFYSLKVEKKRFELAEVMAEVQFLPNISKYVIESTLIIGALFVSAIQFSAQDASHAVAALSVFLAAGSRIAPAVMRMQQGAIQIKMNLGMGQTTLNLVDSLQGLQAQLPALLPFKTEYTDFNPKINIDKLNFRYPNSNFAFQFNHSLQIKSGETFAIVGPSGSGKTTLVDLLLGILEPNSGSVLISGLPSLQALVNFPGAIAYVPQDVQIVSGSFRDNVCLGYDSTEVPESEIWRSAEVAQLSEFIRSLPMGLDTAIGESGTNLSGGQRQRLGIARALLTNPRLLVMDEATSSLDSQTENALSNAIRALSGRTTLVIIAHRLSTVRDADQVCYVREGRIEHVGTFEEVRAQVPEFATQAQIMGL
jgi:ABC-type multidrug transport system fused ATPase/permease subunit